VSVSIVIQVRPDAHNGMARSTSEGASIHIFDDALRQEKLDKAHVPLDGWYRESAQDQPWNTVAYLAKKE
jgi:hypothetical protein